jgi:oxygen-independent coproporphyrinogen-3 oxidase
VDAGTFKTLQSAGVNRLSIGVQSFSDRLLNTIGRSHSADEAHNAIKLASETGFTNINIDLIYGLPGQSLPDWRQSLERALSTETAHISIYELMVEENTPMAQMVVKNSSILPTEDAMADMEEVTEELLSKVFRRYEISNFARPGCECRHNIHYWRNGSYLGVGAGAVSSLRGVRVCNAAEPRLFCMMVEQNELPIVSMESLCRHARFRESVIMGLRMIDGVNVSELESRFGITPEEYYGKELTELIDTNLLEREDGRLKLTTRALPVANQVLAKLV